MAYADLLRLTTADFDDAATLVEGLLINYQMVDTSAVVNTTSTSITGLATTSISVTVNSGERVLLLGYVSISVSVSNSDATIVPRRNSSNLGNSGAMNTYSSGDTGGYDFYVPIMYVDNPGAGSYTYDIGWAVSAGTIYSLRRRLIGITFQNS